MLTLVHAPRSRSSRFLWLLEEIGEPYDIQYVSIRRSDGSGALDPTNPHPHGKVPVLKDGGLRCALRLATGARTGRGSKTCLNIARRGGASRRDLGRRRDRPASIPSTGTSLPTPGPASSTRSRALTRCLRRDRQIVGDDRVGMTRVTRSRTAQCRIPGQLSLDESRRSLSIGPMTRRIQGYALIGDCRTAARTRRSALHPH